MSCNPATRERLREVAAELRDCDGVIAVDVLAPTEGTHARWSIELVTSDHLQPAVLERLAMHGLSLGPMAPQGEFFEAVVNA